MNTKLVKASLLRRRSSRGAAMVEAAVIFPVLCVFLGLLTFCHAEYDAKLLTMWDAQNQAWAFSTHACQGEGAVVSGRANVAANGALEQLRGQPNDPAKTKTSTLMSVLGAGSGVLGAPGIVERNATSTATWSTYNRTVTSEAWVFCNEQNYNGRFGLFSEVAGFFETYKQNIFNHHR